MLTKVAPQCDGQAVAREQVAAGNGKRGASAVVKSSREPMGERKAVADGGRERVHRGQ
jgi:hypothetical protein